MGIDWKKGIIIVLVAVGLGYGAGRYLQPAEVKIEIKEVVKEIEIQKKDVITIIKEIERPDGTKEKETRIVDRSTIEKEKDEIRTKDTKITVSKSQWKAGALVGLNFKGSTSYGIHVERRILGPIFVGGWGLKGPLDTQAGISVTWEF